MKIKWLGHACFLITSVSGLKVLTDPYEARFQSLISYAPVKESPDIVTISHEHGDHNYTGDLLGSPQIVKGLGRHLVDTIEITGVLSYHDRVAGRDHGSNTIFCFTVDDIRICHCGDLGHPLDDAALHSLGRVDLLLIPTGGPPVTLELKEARAIWQKLSPCVTIPMHFWNEKCSFPRYGVDDLLKLEPRGVRHGRSEVEFTADQLPESQLLILEPAL